MRTQPSHVDEVNALVFASKAHWGYPAEMMEMWRPDLSMTGDEVAVRNAFHGEIDGEIVGMYVLDFNGLESELAALFVKPAHIGSGVGAALFGDAAGRAAAAGAEYLLVESDPHATGFYERVGCRVIGERDSVPEGRTLPLLRIDLHPDGA